MRLDRRYSLWYLLAVTGLGGLLGFYTNSTVIGWSVMMLASFVYYHSQLVTKKFTTTLLKMLRLAVWLSLSGLYLEMLLQILGHRLINLIPALIVLLIGQYAVARDDFSVEDSLIRPHAISIGFVGLSLSVVSIGLAFYHWPVALILPLVWGVEFLIALWWSARQGEAAEFIAAVWAIITVELIWVSSHWLSLYQFPRVGLIISQTAVLGMALSYSLGGLYFHRSQKKLTRALVFEYFAISGIVFMLIIVMTKWTSSP